MRVSLLLIAGIASCIGGPILTRADPTFPADFPSRSIRFIPFTSFTTSDDAESAFKDRAALVIKWNACGREKDYERIRNEIKNKNFTNQGDLAQILSAKIAWLNDPQLGLRACEAPGPMYLPVADNNDPAQDAIDKDTIKRWHNPASPNCQVLLTEDQDKTELPGGLPSLSIFLKVTTDCMRAQVNDAINAMQKNGQMGTDPWPCLLSNVGPQTLASGFKQGFKGDWDPTVRMLTRVSYGADCRAAG